MSIATAVCFAIVAIVLIVVCFVVLGMLRDIVNLQGDSEGTNEEITDLRLRLRSLERVPVDTCGGAVGGTLSQVSSDAPKLATHKPPADHPWKQHKPKIARGPRGEKGGPRPNLPERVECKNCGGERPEGLHHRAKCPKCHTVAWVKLPAQQNVAV